MAQPLYSPDLTSSDHHLFGPLNKALCGPWFTSDQDVKKAEHACLAPQLKTFFSEGLRKLVQWRTECVEKQGEYVEKLC
jgi:hypothetical protein